MTALYSFVIPVLNESAGVVAQLRAVRTLHPDAQLVVVDGGSSDRTVTLAMPLCDLLLVGEPGRALQMNLGARAASGDYLCFLHADTLPEFDASSLRARFFDGPQWGFCRVRLSGQHSAFRLIERAMNARARITHVCTGDQMLFVERKLFTASGGFATIPLMEDVEYCKRLRRVCPPLVLSETVVTSSRRWEEGGILATVWRMWMLRLAWVLGASPHTLWRHYYGVAPAAETAGE